jgi:hypothetical protein
MKAWTKSIKRDDLHAEIGTIEEGMDAPNESYTGYFNVERIEADNLPTTNTQGATQDHKNTRSMTFITLPRINTLHRTAQR